MKINKEVQMQIAGKNKISSNAVCSECNHYGKSHTFDSKGLMLDCKFCNKKGGACETRFEPI